MSMRIHPFGALAFLVALPAWAQSAEGGAMYRCPGNDYNNTISASEAEKLHCKKVENASVTVIQSATPGPRPRPRRRLPDPFRPSRKRCRRPTPPRCAPARATPGAVSKAG